MYTREKDAVVLARHLVIRLAHEATHAGQTMSTISGLGIRQFRRIDVELLVAVRSLVETAVEGGAWKDFGGGGMGCQTPMPRRNHRAKTVGKIT